MSFKKMVAVLLLTLPACSLGMQCKNYKVAEGKIVVNYFMQEKRAVIYARSKEPAQNAKTQILRRNPGYTVQIIIAELGTRVPCPRN